MRVQVADIRIFFEVYGQEWVADGDRMRRRPVLLALHGGPGWDAAGLRHALAPLADTAQLVIPGQRGHGHSDPGTPATWNLARWAADVRELCEVTGVQAPVVLGRSFGGFVAQQYAAAYPQHPSGLILMATSARRPSQEEIVARSRPGMDQRPGSTNPDPASGPALRPHRGAHARSAPGTAEHPLPHPGHRGPARPAHPGPPRPGDHRRDPR